MKKKILVVDDEPKIGEYLTKALKMRNFDVQSTTDGNLVLNMMKENKFDLVITDLKMPEITGMELLRKIKEEKSDVGVIVMSGYGTIEDAVESIKVGAYDFITKPFTIKKITELTKSYFKSYSKDKNRAYNTRETHFGDMLGRSEEMKEVFSTIDHIAPTDVTVFIQGPTGTGKEMVANALQERSKLKDKPYIKVNCAALPAGLMESELFGHAKGAYTGAIRERKGMFELADGGTILLDEISEMELSLQAKLLRVLQTGEIQRIGDESYKKVNVRVIATTNRDIEKEIDDGNFREDLFYRLNVVPIFLPALDKRKDDIPLLAHYFVRRVSIKYGKPELRLSEEVVDTLLKMSFPGNVRELENKLERAVVLCKNDEITPKDLIDAVNNSYPSSKKTQIPSTFGTIEDVERELILSSLSTNDGNKAKTANELGITARTLRNKINRYKQEGII
ncbi:MAG: sigma-54-dependent Fis family transcriptional regulator [Candidatus Marinimicrobia bacterium]|nr:sigma-54-dependent Fis family transcriptional regulator [Candidatus Neomarinimicrobiota bacterium]